MLAPMLCMGQALRNPESFTTVVPQLTDNVYSQTGSTSKKFDLQAIKDLFGSNVSLNGDTLIVDSDTVIITGGSYQNLIQVNDSTFYITGSNDTIIIRGIESQSLVLGAKDDTSQALGISGGNSILVDIRDGDFNATNELQNLVQLTDSTFVISGTNDTILINKQFLLLGATSPNSRRLIISDGNYVDININDLDADSTNEIQAISISNDTIYLEDGGFVLIDTSLFMRQNGKIMQKDSLSVLLSYRFDDKIVTFEITDSVSVYQDGGGGMLRLNEGNHEVFVSAMDISSITGGFIGNAAIVGSHKTSGISSHNFAQIIASQNGNDIYIAVRDSASGVLNSIHFDEVDGLSLDIGFRGIPMPFNTEIWRVGVDGKMHIKGDNIIFPNTRGVQGQFLSLVDNDSTLTWATPSGVDSSYVDSISLVFEYTPTDSADANYLQGQETYDANYYYIKIEDTTTGSQHLWRRKAWDAW